jgi:hypothetical protein
MPTLSRNKNPFAPHQIVRAVRTFAHQDGVVHIGEEFRGGDPVVEANWSAFVPGETLDQELENVFDVLPEPPQHAPESRCSRSRSRLIGRCAAPSTSRLRCTGHRIAQAPGAGRRRHSFAPSFGLARSSTSSTNTSAGIRSGSAGSSGMSRLGTSPAWSGTSAKGGEHGSETPYRPDAHG